MDLRSKIKEWQDHYQDVTLTDILSWYKKLLKRLPDISHLKNVVLFGSLATLMIFILFVQRFSLLNSYIPKDPIYGGTFEEGVVGKIEQLNPLFSPTNSAETTATTLIFSGLTKENGLRRAQSDLAEQWEVSSDGREYRFILRDNLYWHDGYKLTAEDVSFTVETIQNPDTKAALFKVWEGVEVAIKGEKEVTFKLKTPYSGFLSETDLPILPKHVLKDIPARNLKVAEFSTKPIGSGPFKFVELKEGEETQTVILKGYDKYHVKKPYIDEFLIKTYPSKKTLNEAYVKKEVTAIERAAFDSKGKNLPGINYYQLSIPAYDALYFNLRNGFGKEKGFREAISFAVSRPEIIEGAFDSEAISIYGPILPGFIGRDPKLKREQDLATAKARLVGAGFAVEPGVIKKEGKPVALRLLVNDQPAIKKEAQIIAQNLKDLGIEVIVEAKGMADLSQNYIRPRDFDLLLASQNLGIDSDLYPFWHSTQVNDPGLNLSGFTNPALDKYLEQGRQTNNQELRKKRYLDATKIIFEETPAVFLVLPSHLYGVSREVKGLENMKVTEPKSRFWNVESWYLKEKREK